MAQVKFKVEDGLLVRGQANVTGDAVISGTLTVGDGTNFGQILNPINIDGNLTPNTNDTYLLGNTANRWSVVYSVGGNFSDSLNVTNLSSLFGGAYLEANVAFNVNNHSVGNTVAAPILHSTNTFVYDTLRVGSVGGSAYLITNSTTTTIQSNVTIVDDSLTLGNELTKFYTAANRDFDISYTSSSPTVVDEFLTNEEYRLVKYYITVSVPYNDDDEIAIQTSEVTLLVNGANTSISEFNVMTNPTSVDPIVSYSVARATGLIRLTGYATSAVTNSLQPNVNISFVRMTLK